jgi:class 3 adenylate cyclase
LKPEHDHAVPILAVYDILCTCAALMLVQLALGRPIRGGLDVGTGVEVDGELFGASLVKAYRLESKEAGYPRLLVGQDLVNYLQTSTHAPGSQLERQFERMLAASCLRLLAADTDARSILDYAGPQMRDILRGHLDSATERMFADARAFAHTSRSEYQRQGPDGQKLFQRYSQLVPYLDARAWLWGDTT